MKLLNLILSSCFLAPTQLMASNDYQRGNHIRREEWKTIDIDSNVDIYSKNLRKVDIKRSGNYWLFESEAPTQLFLNKDQSSFVNDMKNDLVEIKIHYVAAFNTDKVRGQISETHLYNRNMRFEKTEGRIVQKKLTSEEPEVEIDSSDSKILFNFKDGKTALQVKPIMKIDPEKFEYNPDKDNLGFYRLYIDKITLLLKHNYVNLSAIKMKPIHIKTHNTAFMDDVTVESRIQSEIENVLHNGYLRDIKDVIDMSATRGKIKTDVFNFDVPNTYYVELVPKKDFVVFGTFVQEVIYDFDRLWLGEIERENQITSSTLHKVLYKNYIGLSDLSVEINLDNKMIKLENDLYEMNKYFINDGPLEKILNYKSLKIIKNGEMVAQLREGKIIDIDYDRTEYLLDELVKKEEHQEEIISENNIDNDGFNESEAEENEPTVKHQEAKHSSPLKYLWLLAIPFIFGTFCLITWLMPFIKRKK